MQGSSWWACQVSNGGFTHWQAIADPSDAGSAPEIMRGFACGEVGSGICATSS
jgi:hypothetical protein